MAVQLSPCCHVAGTSREQYWRRQGPVTRSIGRLPEKNNFTALMIWKFNPTNSVALRCVELSCFRYQKDGVTRAHSTFCLVWNTLSKGKRKSLAIFRSHNEGSRSHFRAMRAKSRTEVFQFHETSCTNWTLPSVTIYKSTVANWVSHYFISSGLGLTNVKRARENSLAGKVSRWRRFTLSCRIRLS